jgi:hypothetical protein
MKIVFASSGAPARTCELCLMPMKFLGDQIDCRLFRCEDGALVSTESVTSSASPYNVMHFS